MDISECLYLQLINGKNWNPEFGESEEHKNRIANSDLKTCVKCRNYHGKIWEINATPEEEPPLHPHCRCVIMEMTTIKAGTATINGKDGADWHLKYTSKLPDYYISIKSAKEKGWERGSGHLFLSPTKCCPVCFIILTVICRQKAAEFGMRQTSTIHQENETAKEYSGQMTA